MTKQAHITSGPEAQLGDRVLGLCGKKFKFKTRWDDIPTDKPICRECVDHAIMALDEADLIIQTVRVSHLLVESRVRKTGQVLNPEDGTILDRIVERDMDHRDAQALKRAEKEMEEQAKQTCTCTWTTPEIFTEDPECPIHGGHSDAIGVEITEGE